MSGGGFYKRRRGVLEHMEAGRISLLDAGIHDLLCLKANAVVGNGSLYPPGVWCGSARAIHAFCPKQISERAVQRSLDHLEKLGWIKRWMRPGARGNYPILIARYSVRELSGKEYIVNAEATTDWRRPVLVPVGDVSAVGGEAVTNLATLKERRRESGKKSSRQPSGGSDSAQRLVALLRERILANNPGARITEKQLREWATEADLMMRVDGRAEERIAQVISWSQGDSFWKTNILSMRKVREKFDQLVLKMEADNGKPRGRKLSGEELTEHNLRAAGFTGTRAAVPRPVRGNLPPADH